METSISVVGDSLALLLAARKNVKLEGYEIGYGIIGTGYNIGMFHDEKSYVYMDASGFNKFPMTKLAQTQRNGRYWSPLGTEVNGNNLYKHFNVFIGENNIEFPSIENSRQLSQLCEHEDKEIAEIAQKIIKRAAQLAACQIAGVARFKNSNMLFAMEGRVFWKGYGFKEVVEQTVETLLSSSGLKVQFLEIENSGVIGAASIIVP